MASGPADGGPLANLRGDIGGGLAAALVALPVAIGCGFLAFSPLGPGYAGQGALAGLYTAIFVTVVASLLGGTPFQISGPKTSLAVVIAALIATLMADPRLPADADARVAAVLTLTFLCVAMAGALQVLLGVLRLGTVIKFIPYPVTAGFMNGLAVIIVLGQVPILMGADAGPAPRLADLAVDRPLAPVVALITVATMVLARRRLPSGLEAVVALAAGTAAHHLLATVGDPAALGGVIGAIPQRVPRPDQALAVLDILGEPGIGGVLLTVAASALVLALLGSVESLLGAVAADGRSGTRHDSNRELLGQGLGNVTVAAFGGLAGGGSPARVAVNYRAGGRTRLSSLVHGLFFAAVVSGLGPLVGHVPLAATAGILVVYAVGMVDDWTRRLMLRAGRTKGTARRGEVLTNLSMVLLVTVLTVAVDLIAAVAVGFMVASFLFVVRAGRSPVHRHYTGDTVHSKNARSLGQMNVLRGRGRAISVVEAQGPIFFGSADRLAERVETILKEAEIVILDLKRVTEVDATGADIVRRLDGTLARQGKTLLISYLPEDHPLWGFLEDMELARAETAHRIFPDTDSALARAEDMILTRELGHAPAAAAVPLRHMEVLSGMTEEHIRVLESLLTRHTFRHGERIFTAGDTSDDMYFLSAGTVSVRAGLVAGGRTTRLAGFGPGVIFGEMALLAGIPRTATVEADEEVVCYAITRDDFDRLAADHPDIAIRLLRNMGRLAAVRLQLTSEEVRTLER